MTNFFDKVRSAPSTFVDSNDGMLTDVRLVIYRHGECPQKVIQTFYEEHRGECNFSIIPMAAYGNPPRPELCTKRSLADALQVADIEPNSNHEMQWRSCCDRIGATWPKRLTRVA